MLLIQDRTRYWAVESGLEPRGSDSYCLHHNVLWQRDGGRGSSHMRLLFLNTSCTSLNIASILVLVLAHLKMFISPISVFESPLVLSKTERVVSLVNQNISLPSLELNFSPLNASFAEVFVVPHVQCLLCCILCILHSFYTWLALKYGLLIWIAFRASNTRLNDELDPAGNLGLYRLMWEF